MAQCMLGTAGLVLWVWCYGCGVMGVGLALFDWSVIAVAPLV